MFVCSTRLKCDHSKTNFENTTEPPANSALNRALCAVSMKSAASDTCTGEHWALKSGKKPSPPSIDRAGMISMMTLIEFSVSVKGHSWRRNNYFREIFERAIIPMKLGITTGRHVWWHRLRHGIRTLWLIQEQAGKDGIHRTKMHHTQKNYQNYAKALRKDISGIILDFATHLIFRGIFRENVHQTQFQQQQQR